MKKPYILPIIMFVISIITYIVLDVVYSNRLSPSSNFVLQYLYFFIPAIFFEIAIFGSVIIYFVSKRNKDDKDNNDDKDNKHD